MRRKESSIPYFSQRIPADVKSKAVGRELFIPVGDKTVHKVISAKAEVVKVSLGTRDPSDAKIRQGEIAGYLEGIWKHLREGKEQTLTFKQAVSLAGDVYKAFVGAFEDDPGSTVAWQRVIDENDKAQAGRIGLNALRINRDDAREKSLEARFGGLTDAVLNSRNLIVDQVSRQQVLEQVAVAAGLSAEKIERFSLGDYSPDTDASRFPDWSAEKPTAHKAKSDVAITQLLAGWWKEAGRNGGRSISTYESYSKAVRYFVDFLGHDDAAQVTPRDVVGYKDKRLDDVNPRTGKPISAKTIKDSELSGLKTIFKWGAGQHLIPGNPAEGITVATSKPKLRRSKGFTEDEAVMLLRHCMNYTQTQANEVERLINAKRWVPWVCAYTGARVGEIVQLRKADLINHGEHYEILITPEAVTVKDGEYRKVPVHPHLVETGFVDFIRSQADGYLFLKANAKGEIRGSWNSAKNRLREFVRQVVTDPDVKPNHGWRHRFITVSRECGMSQELRRMITGHTGMGTDEREYGDPAGLYREICKFPHYKV
jgi:integrase